MSYKYTYAITVLFYLTVITDIIALAFLGSDSTALGELDLMLTLFLLERFFVVAIRLIGYFVNNQKSKDMVDMCTEMIATVFFCDFFIASMRRAQWQKDYEQWIESQRNIAKANNGKVPRNQNTKFTTIKESPMITPAQLHQIRAYFYTLASMFIQMHAQFSGMGTNGGCIVSILFSMIFFSLAVTESYHIHQENEYTIKEKLFMFVIIYFELMAKLFLWGYFVSLTYPKGVWVYIVLLFFGGFLLEISFQCMSEENQEEQSKGKKGFFRSMIGPCGNIQYCIKMAFLPMLVGIQLAFYGRYEDIMVKELDEENKTLKKGNTPLVVRGIEWFLLFLVSIVCMSQDIKDKIHDIDGEMVEFTDQVGYFVLGLIAILISAAWNIFYAYKKICKKQPYQKSFRPPPLEYEGATEVLKNKMQDKKKQFFGLFGKKEDKYKEQQQPNDPQQQDPNQNQNVNQQQQQHGGQNINLADNNNNQPQDINAQNQQQQQQPQKKGFMQKAKGFFNKDKQPQQQQQQQQQIPNNNNNNQNNNQQQKQQSQGFTIEDDEDGTDI